MQDFAKRASDIAVSAAVLLLASPLLAIVSLLVWCESGAPVFFRQQRVGAAFRRFNIFKFRTMRVNTAGPKITVGGDHRVTRVGRFLRASKIDELPQFWNVLRGDMSIVGPRPEVPEFVEMFRERYEKILKIRPGITDLASVSLIDEERLLERSEDPLRTYREEILPMKLSIAEEYLDSRSALLDFAIIGVTALSVFHRGMGQTILARFGLLPREADRFARP